MHDNLYDKLTVTIQEAFRLSQSTFGLVYGPSDDSLSRLDLMDS